MLGGLNQISSEGTIIDLNEWRKSPNNLCNRELNGDGCIKLLKAISLNLVNPAKTKKMKLLRISLAVYRNNPFFDHFSEIFDRIDIKLFCNLIVKKNIIE